MKTKVVALLSALLVCVAISGLAVGSGSTTSTSSNTVSATLGAVITVEKVTDAELSGVAPGQVATGSNQMKVTSQNAGYDLAASAEPMSITGHSLAALQISNSGQTGTFTGLAPLAVTVFGGQLATDSLGRTHTAYYEQAFAENDPAGIYTTTVSWTATASW